MKKILFGLFSLLLIFGLFSCSLSFEEVEEEISDEGYMTYAEFKAAEVGAEVKIAGYIQYAEDWWDNKQTIYVIDKEGNGYFLYEVPVSELESAFVIVGSKVHVTGKKAEWKDQVEVVDITDLQIYGNDNYTHTPVDVTATLTNANAKADFANQLVKIRATLGNRGTEEAPLPYTIEWDNSADYGNKDIYINFSTALDNFTIIGRRYFGGTGEGSIYKTLSQLTANDIGQTFTITFFVYMYDGQVQGRIIDIQR